MPRATKHSGVPRVGDTIWERSAPDRPPVRIIPLSHSREYSAMALAGMAYFANGESNTKLGNKRSAIPRLTAKNPNLAEGQLHGKHESGLQPEKEDHLLS